MSVLIVLCLSACSDSGEPVPESSEQNVSSANTTTDDSATYVRTTTVQLAPAAGSYRFSGVLRATDQAQLAFLVSGELASLSFKIGDRVINGDELAVIRNPQLTPAANAANARVAELKTRVSQAKRDRNRVDALRQSGAATREEYEQVNAQYRALISSLNTAQASAAQAGDLAKETVLRAPFSGTVSAVLADAGDFVAAGQPVLVVSGAEQLEIELGLPETLLNQLAVGQMVQITLPLQGNLALAGTISEIASAAPAAGKLFPVIITVASSNTAMPRSGSAAEVLIAQPANSELVVPLAAVMDPGTGQPFVFRIQKSNDATTVERVPVTVGNILGENITVTAGALRTGDEIVYVGLSGLLAGETVQILPTK